MQKRGYLIWGSIAKGILVLVILGLTFKIVIDLTGNPVQYLLGIGNISKLDQDIVERYETTKNLNQDAITSINGLLYGINSLAVFDEERKEETGTIIQKVKEGFVKKEDIGIYKKDFGDVKVEPTYFDRRTVYLKGDKENAIDTLIKTAFDCWGIFGDKADENTRCFLVKIDKDVKLEWLNDFDDYFKNFDCNKLCKDAKEIGECKDKCEYLKYDLSGSRSWNPFSSFFGLFNSKNYEYGITPKLIAENNYEFRICGSNRWVNEIHFSVKEDYCKTPKEDLAFGYIVENFALPQTIQKSDSPLVYGVEEWLNAYGDPEYILFYEKFPKEEAEYWSTGAYKVAFLTILGTEAVFLGIDVLTWGMGKLLKPIVAPIATVIKKGLAPIKNAIKGFGKAVGTALGKALRFIWSKTGERAVKAILTKELTEETLEQGAKGAIRKALGKEAFDGMSDEIVENLQKQYVKAFRNVKDAAIEGVFDVDGKLTKQGLNLVEFEFKQLMSEVPDVAATAAQTANIRTARVIAEREALGETFDDTTKKAMEKSIRGNIESELKDQNYLAKEVKKVLSDQYDNSIYKLGKELSENAYQAGFRTVPRNLIRAYKVAGRSRNMLKEIFLGDMTDAKRMEVVMAAMDDWEEPFRAMKPHELRTFIANQKAATEMLDKMIEGEIGDVAEKGAAQALRQNMDNALEKVIKERGDLGKLFPIGVKMQEYSAAVLRAEGKVAKSVITKPRHLVALMAGYYATKIESMQAKFNSVGTNAIGLKIPYTPSIPYDDELTKSITTIDKEKEWLKKYGSDERYTGLLPVVNRYYLSITKDQFAWWFDQEPQRFHLVSPCYADIILTVSNCDCKGSEDEEVGLYETGKTYQIQGTDENGNKIFTGEIANVPHFDGEKPMLYRLDENGDPIKECYAGKWYRWDDPYPTKCIKINPILNTYKDFEYNYCYHGKNQEFEIAKGVITSLEVGLPLLCSVASLGVATVPCFAGLGFIGGLAGETIKSILETQHKWPNRS